MPTDAFLKPHSEPWGFSISPAGGCHDMWGGELNSLLKRMEVSIILNKRKKCMHTCWP